jgi:CARDB protein
LPGRSRRLLLVTVAAATGVAVALTGTVDALTPAQKRLRKKRALPDLIVNAVQEPPDFAKPGDKITLHVTVSNEGRTRAGRGTNARVLLSTGRSASADDIRMPGVARIPALNPGQEFTRKVVVTIPASTPVAAYYFVACADFGRRVREYQDGTSKNCKLSGQAMDLRDRPVGPPGPTGPPGEAGRNGSRGDVRQLPRHELDVGDRLFEPEPAQPGNDEGSTQTFDALTIGPITIRYLCRQTTNGDSREPGAAFGAADSFDQDGDEAKVLLYSTGDGTFSFSGPQGQRSNIPSGSGTPDRDDEGGGEGKRMVLNAVHDPDPDSTYHDRDGSRGDQGPFDNEHQGTEPEYISAFKAGSAYVAHASGTEFILNVWSGINVLGVGPDRCVFGGTVQVVQG